VPFPRFTRSSRFHRDRRSWLKEFYSKKTLLSSKWSESSEKVPRSPDSSGTRANLPPTLISSPSRGEEGGGGIGVRNDRLKTRLFQRPQSNFRLTLQMANIDPKKPHLSLFPEPISNYS
jgi:hypothetical protein